MTWEDDLREGEELAKADKAEDAFQIAGKLLTDPAALANSKAQQFILRAASAAQEPEIARQMADRLMKSERDDDQLAAATWWVDQAAGLFASGDHDGGIEAIAMAKAIAPSYEERFYTDSRIRSHLGMAPPNDLNAIAEHVRENPAPTKGYLRAIKKARDLLAKGEAHKACTILQSLEGDEPVYLESIRVGLEAFWKMGYADASTQMATLLCMKGNKKDRAIAADWFLSLAAKMKHEERIPEAFNTMAEAVRLLPEYRESYAADTRVAMFVPKGLN